MHAVADCLLNHVVAPTVMVFSNVTDDLDSKRMLKNLRENDEGALVKALCSQI